MTDFADAAKRVRRMADDLEDEHDKATETAMEDTTDMAQNQLEINDSVARGMAGGLLSRLHTRSVFHQNTIAYGTIAPPPALYVEYGTGQRGMKTAENPSKTPPAPSTRPPVEPILEWIVEKNIQPEVYDTQYGLADAIAELIGEKGTRAHPFLRRTWFGFGKEHVEEKNADAMQRAVRRYF